MNKIIVLPKETIDLIAAGEVAERPSAVIKELIENSIDANSKNIAIEIKDGGLKLMRVSDDGSGIDEKSLPLAFTAHATSKIKKIEDLDNLNTFGFRGEALSSISAVSKCEVITKTQDSLIGSRYIYEGGTEISLESVGTPNGTTFIVRDIFYNTPARLKFLKSASTEASYVTEVVENAALSHPEVSFSYISNGRNILHTLGKDDLSECIFRVYGKDAYNFILPINYEGNTVNIRGYYAKPSYFKSNRNFEKFFVNNRPIRSNIISKACEEAYSPYLMNHQFPFVVLFIDILPSLVDVNVHPSKAEVRFDKEKAVFDDVYNALSDALKQREMIPEVKLDNTNATYIKSEESNIKEINTDVSKVDENNDALFENKDINETEDSVFDKRITVLNEDVISISKHNEENPRYALPFENKSIVKERSDYEKEFETTKDYKQLNLFEEKLLSRDNVKEYNIVGQIFNTYWIVEYNDQIMIIDQHAAHEKVLFERYYKQITDNKIESQLCSPSIIVTLSGRDEEILKENIEVFNKLGFEIEHFGGREYSIISVPQTLNGISNSELFTQILSDLSGFSTQKVTQSVYDRIASMACKAAVKGNMNLSSLEANALIDELLKLENPYHCPHGRPTIITMTKNELEKKFKRII